MTEVWPRVAALRGRTLRTLTRGYEFSVDRVGDTFVLVTPSSTGKPRRISRQDLEAAHALGRRLGRAVGPGDIQRELGGSAEHNSSYMAAMLRTIG